MRTATLCNSLLLLVLVGCGIEGPRPALPSGRRHAAAPTPQVERVAPQVPLGSVHADGLQPLPIVQHITGDDAAFQAPKVFLIQSRQELAAVGSVELINHPIDFDRYCLVVLSLGQQPTGGYWARITAAQLQGDVLYVQGFVNRPSAGQAVSQAITHPYAAAVIPKAHPRSVQSDIQSLTDQAAPSQ